MHPSKTHGRFGLKAIIIGLALFTFGFLLAFASPGGDHAVSVLCENPQGFPFFIEIFFLEHNEVGKAFGQAVAFCVSNGGKVISKETFHP